MITTTMIIQAIRMTTVTTIMITPTVRMITVMTTTTTIIRTTIAKQAVEA